MHTPPEDVTSPRDRWTLTNVLYDGGSGEVAIAYGIWDEHPAIGIRWNGTDESGDSLGNPQSSGHPTWFILPDSIAAATLMVLLEKRAAGNQEVNEDGISSAARAFQGVQRFVRPI